MSGHSSRRQDGFIRAYPAAFRFRYPDRPRGLVLSDLIATDIKTKPGDSGALLVDVDRRPLGMLIGRAGRRSFFMHIRNVVDALGLADL